MSIKEKSKYVPASKIGVVPGKNQFPEFKLDSITSEENKDFISIVSHNIRNPISAVSGYSELLIEDLPATMKDDLLTYLIQIKQNADITFKYIDKFFEWMYYKSGKIKMEYDYHNLFCLIEESIKATVPKSEFTHKISLNIDPSIEVFADKNSVIKIFYYLIENAILFTQQGGEIYINAYLKDSMVVIEIIDSGIGMGEDLVRVLFDKTKNINLFKNKIHNGTGLSLILVDEFIKLNNGSLSLASQVNQGTKVNIKLPY